jgi:cyclase
MIGAAPLALRYAHDSTKIIPGHGPLGNKADLLAYRDMLVKIRDRVAPLIKAGKTKDEVIAAKPTADLDAKWATGFLKPELFLGLVYDSMKKQQ